MDATIIITADRVSLCLDGREALRWDLDEEGRVTHACLERDDDFYGPDGDARLRVLSALDPKLRERLFAETAPSLVRAYHRGTRLGA